MKREIFLRTPFNYDTDKASAETALICDDPSLAQQQFRDDADINTLVQRFALTGQLPHEVAMPQYGDFTSVTDYRTALHAVMAAEDAFMSLPADVRSRFANDPQLLLEFVSDPANYDEAVKLGLSVAPPKEPAKEPAKEPQAPSS